MKEENASTTMSGKPPAEPAPSEAASATADDPVMQQLATELFHEFGIMHHRFAHKVNQAMSGEMAVLRALELAQGPLTPSQIADKAWVSNARVANILKVLEEKGQITRAHSSEDRRRVLVKITPEGHDALKRKHEQFHEGTIAFLEKLGEEDARDLARILHRFNEIIDEKEQRKERSCMHEDR